MFMNQKKSLNIGFKVCIMKYLVTYPRFKLDKFKSIWKKRSYIVKIIINDCGKIGYGNLNRKISKTY